MSAPEGHPTTPESTAQPDEGPPDPQRRRVAGGCLIYGGLLAAVFFGGSSVLQFLSRFKLSYDPGPTGYKQLDINNDSAIWRAATVRLSADGAFGHGCVLEANNELYIYTIQHVAEALRRSNTPQMSISGVGTLPIHPDRLRPAFGNPKAKETDVGFVYDIRPDQQGPIRSAIAEKVIKPLNSSRSVLNIGDIVLIPRADRFVYTIYQIEGTLPQENRIVIRTPNNDNTNLCRGDSGAPVLRYPITGEVFGVVAAAYSFQPETSMSNKDCSSQYLFRPNG